MSPVSVGGGGEGSFGIVKGDREYRVVVGGGIGFVGYGPGVS